MARRGVLFALYAALALLSSAPSQADHTVYYGTLYPLIDQDEAGRPTGYYHAVMVEIARRTGRRFDYKFVPWLRAQKQTSQDVGSLLIGLVRTPEREASFHWIAPVAALPMAFFTLKPAAAVNSFDQARSLDRIAVTDSGPFHAILRRQGFDNSEGTIDEPSNARKLYAHRVDAWFTFMVRAPPVVYKLGLDVTQLVEGAAVAIERTWLVTGPSTAMDDKLALAQVLTAMEADGTLNRIRAENGLNRATGR